MNSYAAKYQHFMKNCWNVCLKHVKGLKGFIEYLSDTLDIYNTTTEENNQKRGWKLLIEFNDTITDMIVDKRPHSAVTELFIRDKKQNVSLLFLSQSHFAVLKDARVKSTHSIMKISKRQDFQ